MAEAKRLRIRKKALIRAGECVACGCCTAICPLGAIKIIKGIYAIADESKCVGCGKCAAICPASVIDMMEAAE